MRRVSVKVTPGRLPLALSQPNVGAMDLEQGHHRLGGSLTFNESTVSPGKTFAHQACTEGAQEARP